MAIIVGLFLWALARRSHAEEQYAQVGVGSTYLRGATSAIDLSFVYPNAAPRDAVLEVGATFIGDSSTPHNGPQPNNFALRATIIDYLWHFEVGMGVAWLQNADTYNGSHTNFNLMLGYRIERWPLTLRLSHFSNGGTVSPNKGRDMLFVVWRFQ